MPLTPRPSSSPHSLIPEPWKSDILIKLGRRNRVEGENFKSVFDAYGRLFEHADSLKSQSIQLNLQVEKLKEENLRIAVRGGDAGDPKASEKVAMLEQKIYRLQEELTDLHRKKGDNAQQLVDMRNQLQEKERILLEKDRKIQDQEAMIYTTKQAIKQSEAAVLELERSNQLLKDEQQALHIAYCSMEEKFRKMALENQELIDRWLKLKAQEVDRMNQEAEASARLRQRSMQHDILEAAKEPVNVNLDNLLRLDEFSVPPICCVIIPSVAQRKIDAHEGEVNAVRWSPTGRYFATGGADRKVKLWETGGPSGPECRGILTGSNAAVMSVEFDPGESLVVGASNDFAARVWTISDQRLRHTLTGHSGKVLSCKFISGPNRVVSGSHDRTLKLWDLRSRACEKTIFAGSSCNDLVVYGSQNIISGHFDKKIRFWDTRSDNSVNELLLQGKITSLDLSSDGFYLLSCSRDDLLRVIDVRMNQVTVTLAAENFKVGCDWSRAVFSPDGQYAMAGSNDGNLYVFNLKTGQVDNVEKILKEHPTTITACSWHPQGNQLLSCDRNKKVILWSDM
ncbi:autophagy-related protein 16-1-like isoform X2 [Paramacrobiotus metropolitanus]|uniref:autophagy-related protein 16-1-like isoform X2 n=1 Tax=Paramacrobiotus metropolitanus TaxID=2943436 RepID=UPI002445E987|nr:autophagy-related protein 16-1-like isoform X2 [Paramacrobiotus metropolitanus]